MGQGQAGRVGHGAGRVAAVFDMKGGCSVNVRGTTNKVSGHFPPLVRFRLIEASQTPVPNGDPMARVRAIDAATQWARDRFPELFRWVASEQSV